MCSHVTDSSCAKSTDYVSILEILGRYDDNSLSGIMAAMMNSVEIRNTAEMEVLRSLVTVLCPPRLMSCIRYCKSAKEIKEIMYNIASGFVEQGEIRTIIEELRPLLHRSASGLPQFEFMLAAFRYASSYYHTRMTGGNSAQSRYRDFIAVRAECLTAVDDYVFVCI